MYEPIFLKENEKDIFRALKEKNINSEVFKHHFSDLFKKVYNNEVGYYIFKQDTVVYKIIVLPKTIEASETAEKEFVNYLLHYYRVNNLYGFDKEKKIPNSLLQLAFKSNNSTKSSHHFLNEFQAHRYMAILQKIETFFKRHKNSKRIKVNHVSQSIKHRLDLRRNIRELDKSKIHQTQSKDVVFSIFATITFNTLKLFVSHKLNDIEGTYSKTLFLKLQELKSMLLKKYNIERGYKLTISNLQGIKIEKIFSKTEENRELLVDIKSLFGFEQMYRDSALSVKHREDLTTTSLFINSSNFYEWYVYDILKKYADANGKTIEFDKKEGTSTKYYLNSHIKSSNPDYILTDEANKVKVIIDAKWKNVNAFADIKPSDYLKLRFDASLLERKNYVLNSYLIYPKILIIDRSFLMKIDNKSIFSFNAFELDMHFEKHENSLDFDFDLQTLDEDIEINIQIESLKSKAKELGDVIENSRAEVTRELIEENDAEVKEELKAKLDDEIVKQALVLTEKLDKQTLLPEIEKILERYHNVLEDESKKFLKSSSAIYSYYKDKNYEHFDYSMPGSGFWKLIELELNTSFIWHIRIESRVCTNSCPWTNISVPNQKVSHKIVGSSNVVLNKSETDNSLKLQGVMLGNIKSLALDDNTLNQFFSSYFSSDEVSKRFIENDLVLLIEKVSKLRNEHAHIKAMSLEKFEELWNILFKVNEDRTTLLEKLLEFKKNVKEKYA